MSMRRLMALALVLILVFAGRSPHVVWAKEMPAQTALDHYVAAADDSYVWQITKEESAGGRKTVVINMVSQTWRDHDDVDRPEWQHWLTVWETPGRWGSISLLGGLASGLLYLFQVY